MTYRASVSSFGYQIYFWHLFYRYFIMWRFDKQQHLFSDICCFFITRHSGESIRTFWV